MRFAFLSQTWPENSRTTISGSSVQVYYIAKELASRVYPVLVILSSESKGSYIYEDNLTVASVPAVGGPPFLIKSPWLKKVRHALKQFKPDVIYQRGKLPETIAAATFARASGACFIWLSNSDKSPERWKWVKKRWARRREVLRLVPRLADAFLTDVVIEKSMKNADIVIAQNENQKEELKKNFGLNSNIINSGHPIPPFKEKSNTIPKVLWLANFTHVKRPLLFAELARELKELQVKFIMAGNSNDRELLQKVLTITKKNNNFSYLGDVSLSEGNALMDKADIFVLTSEYEGLPNTFVQACIHGVPTITLVKDPRFEIRKYNVGVVAETFYEMKDTLRLWVQDTELRENEGRRAYELAKSEFDIKTNVDRLIEVIQSR